MPRPKRAADVLLAKAPAAPMPAKDYDRWLIDRTIERAGASAAFRRQLRSALDALPPAKRGAPGRSRGEAEHLKTAFEMFRDYRKRNGLSTRDDDVADAMVQAGFYARGGEDSLLRVLRRYRKK